MQKFIPFSVYAFIFLIIHFVTKFVLLNKCPDLTRCTSGRNKVAGVYFSDFEFANWNFMNPALNGNEAALLVSYNYRIMIIKYLRVIWPFIF